ncbi:TPA: AbrB/MazE/SpoVT family DNA-binding domain-containing protein [Candidatus Woesearchaeota archaeon]|nr:AbrB/MazE/SpoVT family DNA-binding domain-containing protein [Candidatus Woesearchaeota archaeon]
MKCVICNGKTAKKLVEHKEFGVLVGRFPAEICEKCEETYYSEEIVEEIQKKSKELGLFGLARKVKIAELGNSIAIRIPKEISEFLHLKKGEEVLLVPESKRDLHVQI